MERPERFSVGTIFLWIEKSILILILLLTAGAVLIELNVVWQNQTIEMDRDGRAQAVGSQPEEVDHRQQPEHDGHSPSQPLLPEQGPSRLQLRFDRSAGH